MAFSASGLSSVIQLTPPESSWRPSPSPTRLPPSPVEEALRAAVSPARLPPPPVEEALRAAASPARLPPPPVEEALRAAASMARSGASDMPSPCSVRDGNSVPYQRRRSVQRDRAAAPPEHPQRRDVERLQHVREV